MHRLTLRTAGCWVDACTLELSALTSLLYCLYGVLMTPINNLDIREMSNVSNFLPWVDIGVYYWHRIARKLMFIEERLSSVSPPAVARRMQFEREQEISAAAAERLTALLHLRYTGKQNWKCGLSSGAKQNHPVTAHQYRTSHCCKLLAAIGCAFLTLFRFYNLRTNYIMLGISRKSSGSKLAGLFRKFLSCSGNTSL
jgi:hypothetical protein